MKSFLPLLTALLMLAAFAIGFRLIGRENRYASFEDATMVLSSPQEEGL